MEKAKKVLIINAYSFRNRGDSGIIVAMIDSIRKAYSNVEISVMSQFHEQNREYYKTFNVKSVPPVWDIINEKSFIKKYITGFKKRLFYKSQSTEEIDKADLVLSAGGGYLYSSRIGPMGVGFLNVLYHLWISKKRGKKVILFPQSVGPLNYSLDKFLLKKVFNKLDYFFSREHITTELLEDLNLKLKVEEVPDIAFSLNPEPSKEIDEKLDSSNSLSIGITVLDWRFAHKGSTTDDTDNYLSKIANAISSFRKDHKEKVKVYIFPQVTVNTNDGDVAVSEELKNKISENVEVFYLDKINDPKKLIYLYSKMDLFIGSRMHSAIFALAGNVPTIALAYQYKTKGTFNLINLKDYVLDIRTFNEQDLAEKINYLLSANTEAKNIIKNEVAVIKSNIHQSIHSILQ
ncbi:polysaccharide pyruvyl transferase family protein [Tenacibaculum sp. M341]|uniref:polysaccharide pyruvyl transferase family protein n=1 Tax=Tenacibaculum sp. M341 TaxID=2530339 RepID=UPI0010532F6E|nr:polysaccharide pyruvyl transferase family protein [Tenacibaculum sp. M341]TCI84774.1 polysaccharide pyruvyl transferase family protein [Tenacibaculum sp. M341]